MATLWRNWKRRVSDLKREVIALTLALKHPGTPVPARIVVLLVVAYALSPVDLIPDFIPVLGILDDLLLIPLGILLARRLIPPEVLSECRREAASDTKRIGRLGIVMVVSAWLIIAGIVVWFAFS